MAGKTNTLRPPLKWAGGKRWLVPRLQTLWQPFADRRLVEPFCGGLSVALGLRPQHALLGDINPHTVNFYKQLQAGLRITLDMRNDRELYLQHRSEFNQLVTSGRKLSKKTASLFYYLNRTGFNGLCRFNKSGEFNVPFGKHATINYMRDFEPYKAQLKTWEFVCCDFARLQVAAGDFLYADPPYDQVFNGYAAGGFGWQQQLQLAGFLRQHDGPVVASNSATSRILELYEAHGFDLITLPAPRTISRTGDRTPALEMVAARGLASSALAKLQRAA